VLGRIAGELLDEDVGLLPAGSNDDDAPRPHLRVVKANDVELRYRGDVCLHHLCELGTCLLVLAVREPRHATHQLPALRSYDDVPVIVKLVWVVSVGDGRDVVGQLNLLLGSSPKQFALEVKLGAFGTVVD
jgi:hypothetical protein